MIKRHQIFTLLCLIIFSVTGCVDSPAATAEPSLAAIQETPGTTYIVQRGRVTRVLSFSGRIAPVEEFPLYFKTSGYVKEVHVQPGDRVKAGDVLVELEVLQAGSQRNQIALAELDLASVEAALAQAVAEAEVSLELAQEQLASTRALRGRHIAAVAAARVGLDRARDQVARAEYEHQKALDRPWEPEEVRDNYALALQQAQWELETAQAAHDQAVAAQAAHLHALKMAEITVEQAEDELQQLRDDGNSVPIIEVKRAQEALSWLKESSQLVAPVDGEIVSLSLHPGLLVEPFSTVVVIADPSDIEVSARLSDDQLEEVTEGQGATIMLGTQSEHTWTGVVRRLPYPYGTGGSVESPSGVDTSARISLRGDSDQLRLGTLVYVDIVLDEKKDVLWVPSETIGTLQGRTFVTLRDGGRQQRVDVELGLEGEDRVEILEGLKEGQVVILP